MKKSEIAIQVENLSKVYHVGKLDTRRSWRQSLLQNLTSPVQRLRSTLQGKSAFAGDTELWALKDVSFEIKQGEVVGVIGSNGSGKSTLLKILSQITYPTSGVARVYGNVGSLLEVGTGFHPELTGRENIYMNGAVLGMTRREIDEKFDEIVEFSGVGPFLDTPVKRYSSGMRVRLAFSVSANFSPDVLLVDEVLSVGDAEFQKRGLGKVAKVSQEGRTVMMVSHNLSAILSHCDWVIWLNKGELVTMGDTSLVTSQYLLENTLESGTHEGRIDYDNVPLDSEYPFQLLSMSTLDENGNVCSTFLSGAPITLEMEVKVTEPIPFLRIGFEMKTSDEKTIFRTYHNDKDEPLQFNPDNLDHVYRIRATLPPHWLNKGTYYLDPLVAVHRGDWIVNNTRGLAVNVVFDVPNRDYVVKQRPGVIAPLLDWYTVEDKQIIR